MRKLHGSDDRLLLASSWDPAYVKEIANAFAKSGLCVKLVGGKMHENSEFNENAERAQSTQRW